MTFIFVFLNSKLFLHDENRRLPITTKIFAWRLITSPLNNAVKFIDVYGRLSMPTNIFRDVHRRPNEKVTLLVWSIPLGRDRLLRVDGKKYSQVGIDSWESIQARLNFLN